MEELRRIKRLRFCCRAVARDRYGVWTAVTEDLSARGCRIVTKRLLRPGSQIVLALSSDLFEEELEVGAEVVWTSRDALGVAFRGEEAGARPRRGRGRDTLSPERWLHKLLEQGSTQGSGPPRVVPSLARRAAIREALRPRAGSDDARVLLHIQSVR